MKNDSGFSLLEVLLSIGIFSIIAFFSIIPISRLSDDLINEKYFQNADVNRLMSAIESDVFSGIEFLFTENTISIKTLNESGQEEKIVYTFGSEKSGISRSCGASTITFLKKSTISLLFELKKLNKETFSPTNSQVYENDGLFAILIIAKSENSLIFELLAEVFGN